MRPQGERPTPLLREQTKLARRRSPIWNKRVILTGAGAASRFQGAHLCSKPRRRKGDARDRQARPVAWRYSMNYDKTNKMKILIAGSGFPGLYAANT